MQNTPTLDSTARPGRTLEAAGALAPAESPRNADAAPQPGPRPLAAHISLVGEPFTLNELQAMRLRGVLREVLPGAYVPSAISDTPSARAQVAAVVAAEYLGLQSALCRRTAAWVYGCAPMPGELEVVVPRYHRPCPPTARMMLRMSEGVVDEEQICSLGGVNVTSPLRTAMDVAFNSELEQAFAILRSLHGEPRLRCGYPRMLEQVESSVRRPGRLRALAIIRRLMEEPPDGPRTGAEPAR
ncbi:type IV toxin-antitoxin system AbiEi family antitoxin [Paeniglutamicibacter sp. NPDC091659]|uniref:type IV toxin-antitoxin system AbiEi family antitoxin n=1 Tax=Paeniglutamicibacter sp. NPDC091659 TaxID=3364389 RepID=UPI00381D7B17